MINGTGSESMSLVRSFFPDLGDPSGGQVTREDPFPKEL
jgi:hypothetical protein